MLSMEEEEKQIEELEVEIQIYLYKYKYKYKYKVGSSNKRTCDGQLLRSWRLRGAEACCDS